jgi:hypothetical protein
MNRWYLIPKVAGRTVRSKILGPKYLNDIDGEPVVPLRVPWSCMDVPDRGLMLVYVEGITRPDHNRLAGFSDVWDFPEELTATVATRAGDDLAAFLAGHDLDPTLTGSWKDVVDSITDRMYEGQDRVGAARHGRPRRTREQVKADMDLHRLAALTREAG